MLEIKLMKSNLLVDKIYLKVHGKYPASINILKSLTMFCIVILLHQALLQIIALKVSICIVDCAFTKPSVGGPRFLPCHAQRA